MIRSIAANDLKAEVMRHFIWDHVKMTDI